MLDFKMIADFRIDNGKAIAVCARFHRYVLGSEVVLER